MPMTDTERLQEVLLEGTANPVPAPVFSEQPVVARPPMLDVPLSNPRAVPAFTGWRERREGFPGLVLVTGGKVQYSEKTGYEFGCVVKHTDMPKHQFLAGTLLLSGNNRGWFIYCWGPIAEPSPSQALFLFRLNRVQAISPQLPVPHLGTEQNMCKALVELKTNMQLTQFEEPKGTVNCHCLASFFP